MKSKKNDTKEMIPERVFDMDFKVLKTCSLAFITFSTI